MSRIWMKAWKCDKCGHRWLSDSDQPPEKCAKCRARGWNTGKDVTPEAADQASREGAAPPAALRTYEADEYSQGELTPEQRQAAREYQATHKGQSIDELLRSGLLNKGMPTT